MVQRALEAAADRLYHTAEDKAEISVGQRRADALGLLAESALAADLDRGTSGDRYQVVVHVDADVLRADANAGQSALEDDDGIRVPAETSRRIACDASAVVMGHDRNGTVLDVGRKTRTISPAIRRALTTRDRRCRFPHPTGTSPRPRLSSMDARPATAYDARRDGSHHQWSASPDRGGGRGEPGGHRWSRAARLGAGTCF